MTLKIMIGLTSFYVLMALYHLTLDKNYPKCVYWIGAATINIGVLLMK